MNNKSLDIQISFLSLIKFALPTMIANLFMNVYMTVDGIFVSNCISTDALSAINIVMPFITIILAIGILFGTGGSAFIAKQLGESKIKEAKENFTAILVICLLVSSFFVVFGFAFCRPILYFLGANDIVIELCVDYAMPLFFVAPFAMLGMLFQTFFITEGKPNLGMVFSFLGGIANIFLDWILIYVLKMALTGAALATGIGYSIPGILGLLYFVFNKKGALCFSKPKFRRKVILKVVTNGSSEMVTMLFSSIVMIFMNNRMMQYAGEDGVAAISILLTAQSLLTSIYIGYATGVAPITSFNFGRQDSNNLKRLHRINMKWIIILSIATFLISLPLAKPLISIYTRVGTNVFDIAYSGYYLFAISFLFMGFGIYCSSMFTAFNDGKTSALISFLRSFVFMLGSLSILPHLFEINGVWLAVPVAEMCSMFLVLFFTNIKKEVYNYA